MRLSFINDSSNGCQRLTFWHEIVSLIVYYWWYRTFYTCINTWILYSFFILTWMTERISDSNWCIVLKWFMFDGIFPILDIYLVRSCMKVYIVNKSTKHIDCSNVERTQNPNVYINIRFRFKDEEKETVTYMRKIFT